LLKLAQFFEIIARSPIIDLAANFMPTAPGARGIMTCPNCRVKMVEQKRSFHKKRKWICPKCQKARMQAQKDRGKEWKE
jgi:Zn finger protein HypA/HybF involved in hydrogenase expression